MLDLVIIEEIRRREEEGFQREEIRLPLWEEDVPSPPVETVTGSDRGVVIIETGA